jgi:hypothetical protein
METNRKITKSKNKTLSLILSMFQMFYDDVLANSAIRQMQVPIYNKSKVIGYLIVAMSLEDATMVLDNI